ncbi:MAG: YeaH/YhbH family protein [Pseudomonadota bacterium]
MTVRIVDRRFDSKNKSAINRGRFLRRFKGQIRKAVSDAVNRRSVRDLDNGEKIGISGRDIAEPEFAHGSGGKRQIISPGNDRFSSGDQVERPERNGGNDSAASQDGEGLDEFIFSLTRDEFLDIFFDELALPNLVKQQLAHIEQQRRVRAGFTQTGMPSNVNLARTMRGAAGRRIAISGPYHAQLRALEAELEALHKQQTQHEPGSNEPIADIDSDIDAEIERVRHAIAKLRAKIEAIPFVDTFDLRYNNRITQPKPSTQAVMFCLLDVSGSMDEGRKNIAKRFFMLLYLFLTRNYERIDVVFIRHHTEASEVDEETFFTARESGGTIVSTALELMHNIVNARYPSTQWNIYAAQASDGDNWNDDSTHCREFLEESLLPLTQYFAYIEITDGQPQNLWEEYQKLQATHPGHFAMQRIESVTDIYPVFRELFKQRA